MIIDAFQFIFRRLFFLISGIDAGVYQKTFISRWIGKDSTAQYTKRKI